MLTAADIARMKADATQVLGDNEVSITIRRCNATLSPQDVRIERRGGRSATNKDGQDVSETRSGVIILGTENLDIAIDDRFTANGRLYRVTHVRMNEMAGRMAEADIIE